MRTSSWTVLFAALLACGGRGAVLPDTDSDTEGAWETLACVERRKLDILLVVEDSPAMAVEQPQVAAAARWVVEWLAGEGDADFRLAVTSTHVNGPHCPARAGDGALTTTTCRARQADFADPAACLDACPLDQVTTVGDTPWLESVSGRTNLVGDVGLGDAAACLALQGVRGCSFAAPLAAAERALARAREPGAPEYGFLRPDAQIVLAFVGGTSDCSVLPQHVGIFDPAGDRLFWSDPTQPTPGICWNAGVRCTGAPPEFTACAPESWDMNGTPGVPASQAVLVPVEHTIGLLAGMVEEGRTAGVAVTALAGVPVDYPFGGEDIPFSQSCPPEQVAADGICPGCASEQGAGAPPVRVAALVDAFRPDDDRTIASICGGDPTPLWAPLAETLLGKIAVMCVEACAADVDPATAALEPTCEVVEALPGELPKPVPPCLVREVDGAPTYEVPDGETRCHALATDRAALTPSPLDDIAPECDLEGRNVEVRIIRSAKPLDGACLSIRCAPSDRPDVDCPRP